MNVRKRPSPGTLIYFLLSLFSSVSIVHSLIYIPILYLDTRQGYAISATVMLYADVIGDALMLVMH